MKKWLDKYADGGDVPQPKILQDFNKYAESPEGKDYFKMLHDNQRAQQMSGRVEYSDIDPITDIALPFAGIAGTVGKGLVKKGAKDIGELISKKRFKSEINWGNWNKEIPENSQLMKEYHIIEQAAKDNGSWMKYSDGSPFNGTPEQFIQMKHSNTQNFAGGIKEAEQMYKEPLYRGAHLHVGDFANRDRNDYATFLTDSEINAKSYTDVEELENPYYHPDINIHPAYDPNIKGLPLNHEDGLYELGIPQNLPKVIGEAEGKKWRLLNYDDKIAKGTLNKRVAEQFQNDLKENAVKNYDLHDYDPNKQYLSTDIYANYVKNPNNPEAIAQINNVKDQMGFATNIPTNTVYAIDANRVPIKSLRYNNGDFDINKSGIYKALIPGALGVGALQQKKNGGTMQEYQENYNDSQTSLPPGFVGMGNDISGRNYSPAWGGQFAMGGSVPGSVGFTYARTINPAPSEGPYAKKTMPSAEDGKKINNNLDIQEQRYKQLYPPLIDKIVNAAGNDYESLPLGNKTFIESKFDGLNNPEGRNLPPMDPIIKEVQNKLLTLPESELNELLKVNWKHISAPEAFFKKPKNIGMGDMLKYINHFKKLKSQGYTLQNGGEMPSAQNGQEMKYWQEGLDWKPKSISKNGGWLNKYAEGGELPPEVIVEAPPEFVPLEDIPGEPGEPKNSPKKQSDFIYDQNERRSRHSFLESSFNPRAESSKINAKGEKEIIAVGPFGIRDIAIKDYNRLTGENLTRNDAYDFKTAGKIRNVLLDSYDNYDILQDPKLSRENKIRIKYGMYNAGPGTFAKEYNAIKEKYGVYNNPTWYKHLNRETGDYVTRATTRGDSKWEEEYKKGLKQHPDVVRKLRHKDGGNITKDDNGYWNPDNWGKPVEIGSNDITMQGVNQPLLGISDTGDTQYMVPGKDYKFKGKKVREYPVAQNGLRQEQKSLQNLDNLTNFTNYNTPQKGGWLQKYSK